MDSFVNAFTAKKTIKATTLEPTMFVKLIPVIRMNSSQVLMEIRNPIIVFRFNFLHLLYIYS